jgi:uncharacterized protein (TIRG00374 family)
VTRALFRGLRLALYWGLPPVILYVVLTQLDLARLVELGRSADPWLIALGVSLIVPKIFVGAMRWHRLARDYECTRLSASQSFWEYWFSLALGVFTPGSLGSDVYRIALGGRQTGGYLRGAFVIAVEKSAALLSCLVLIASLYPFLTFTHLPPGLQRSVHLGYAGLLFGCGILLLLALFHRSPQLHRLGDAFWLRVVGLANKALQAIPGSARRLGASSAEPRQMLRALVSPRIALPVVTLSLAIHMLGAFAGQIFLLALGFDLPFVVNLFVAPLNALVMALPITVGGIGVREGAFVLFYGAFGVPAETALLVSFCGLLTVMVGHALGGLVFLAYRRQPVIAQELSK